jgi:peroxiredoxin
MKIRYYIYLFLLALVVFSCEDKDSYTIEGNIKGLQNPVLYIVSDNDLRIDTVIAKSGKFTYRGLSQTVEPLLINMEEKSVWITLWVQNGEKYTLTGDANYPELIMVKGGEINKLLTDFKTENLSLIKERCDLRDKIISRMEESAELNTYNDAQFSLQIKNIDQILKTRAQDFVEANPSSIAALVIINDYILDIENASDIQPFLELLTDDVRANPLYNKLQMLCSRDLQTKAGQPALNFIIKNTQNDTISLETFKDKYLVMTFASSQCEYCIPDYEELINIRKNFPEKDLAVLTISLDENKEDWNNFAKENEINWTQAVDSVGWASEIASLYNVLSLPCNYLIDKEGIIIGSKLQVDSIQTILTEKIMKK